MQLLPSSDLKLRNLNTTYSFQSMNERRSLDALLLGSEAACVLRYIKHHQVAREVPGLDRIKTLEKTVWIAGLDLGWYDNKHGRPFLALHDVKRYVRDKAKGAIGVDPDTRRYMPLIGHDMARADRYCVVHRVMWRDCRC